MPLIRSAMVSWFHHNTDRMEKEEKSKKKRMAAKKKEFEERVRQFQETAHKYII